MGARVLSLSFFVVAVACTSPRSPVGGDDDDSATADDDDSAAADDDDAVDDDDSSDDDDATPLDDDDDDDSSAILDDDDSALANFCGDGVAAESEQCDDLDLLGATCNGTVTCTDGCNLDWTGCANHSLEFDGSTTQVQVDDFDLRASQATWEAWVKTRSHVNYGKIIDFGLGGGLGRRFTLQSRSTGFDCDLDGGASGVAFWTTDEVDTWRHIACVWDGSSLGIWVDGVLQETFANTANSTIDVTVEEKYIGHRNGGYFDGHLDEMRVWNVARTPDQLMEGMSTRVNFEAGLVGYWRFDDATGDVAADSSGAGFDGTLETEPEAVGPGPAWSTDVPW